MPARTPEDICRLFRHYMAEGDLDSVLSTYDPEAVFLNQAREVSKGRDALRRELAPLAASKARVQCRCRSRCERMRSRSPAVRPTAVGAGSSATSLPSAERLASDAPNG